MPDEHARSIMFPATTVRVLKAHLNGASDEAVLVFRGPWNEHATVEVVDRSPAGKLEVGMGPLNEAHPCPPFTDCP